MKTIELTEKHKEKLLEMCKALFPEYPNLEVRDSMEDFCSEQDQLFIELNEVINRRKCTIIHWFEFVFTHLISRLQEKMPENLVFRKQPPFVGNVFSWKEGDVWTMYSEFMFTYPKALSGSSTYPNNSIDYLYKEFKKIKT